MKERLMKALPHVVAVILFAVISTVFYQPVLDGYTLKQGDIENFMGMSKELRDYREMTGEEALWTNSAFGGMPAYQISVIHSSNLLKKVESVYSLFLPKPINLMFIAMLGFYILLLCVKVNPWVAIPGAIAFGLATIHMLYIGAGHTAKVKAVAYMAPVMGGVLLTLRGKLITGASLTAFFLGLHLSANHLQMTYYLLILLIFVGVAEAIRLIKEKQIPYLGKSVVVLIIAAGIGLLPSMSNLMTTYEYSKYTTRGDSELTITPNGEEKVDASGLDQSYILEYSMSKGEFWSFLIPDAKGGMSGYIGNDRSLLNEIGRDYREAISQQNRYWGDQRYTGGAFYFGALVVLLFLLALVFLKETALKWSLFILTVVAIMLSWKEPNGLGQFFLDSVPMYSQFRDTKMILMLVMIIMPFLGFVFLDRLIKSETVNKKALFISSGVIVVIMIAVTAAPSSFFQMLSNGEIQQFGDILSQDNLDSRQENYIYGIMESLEVVRAEIFRADAIRSLIFILIGLSFVILLALKKLNYKFVLPAIGVLLLVDLWTVNRRYLDNENLARNGRWQEEWKYLHPFSPSAADMNILNSEQAQNTQLAKKVEEAEEAVELQKGKRNEELNSKLIDEAAFKTMNFNTNFRVLNMGNPFNEATTSFWHKSIGGYHGAKLKRFQELTEFYLSSEMSAFASEAQNLGLMQAFANTRLLNMLNMKYLIYNPEQSPLANPFSQGNAWFARDIEWVPDANTEMQTLADVDLQVTAVVDERFRTQLDGVSGADSTAVVEMNSYLPNRLEYSANSATGGLVVFSEIHYPEGWKATIDGEEAEIIRTNYLLRGLKVPPGTHEIVMSFEPSSFETGSILSLIGSLLVLLLLLGTGVRELMQPGSKE